MIYVTSDLHGTKLERFEELLRKANFSDKDYCFVLGDVIDRGEEGIKLLKWLMIQPNFKLILGNHESMMLSCKFLFDTVSDESIDSLSADDMDIFTNWVENGASPTLKELSESDPESILAILDYLRDAPLYDSVSIDGRDYLLTHSGLANFNHEKKLTEYNVEDFLWNRPNIKDEYYKDITLVFGHTPTYFFGDEYDGKVMITDTWIDIDTGAAYGRNPMLLCLDNMKEYYL